MPFSKRARPLWNHTTPDRLRCFSKHALHNTPGWQLAFSDRPKLQTSYSGHMLLPLLARPIRANETCPSNQAGLTVHLGRSEQRSDTRLSNALADQSYRPLPLNMPFAKLAMPLWHTPDRIADAASLNMPSNQAGLTRDFLWSIWATLWLSPAPRSSWPRLQTSYSGHMLLPLLARQYVPTKHADPTKPGWPFTLVGLSNALTLAWATLQLTKATASCL